MALDLDWELIGRVRRIYSTSKAAMDVVHAKREGQRRARAVMAVSDRVFSASDRLEEFKECRNIKWREVKMAIDVTPKAIRFIKKHMGEGDDQ